LLNLPDPSHAITDHASCLPTFWMSVPSGPSPIIHSLPRSDNAIWYFLGNVAPAIVVTIPQQYYITEVRLATHGEDGVRMASILLLAIVRITRQIASVLVLCVRFDRLVMGIGGRFFVSSGSILSDKGQRSL